MIMLTVYWFGFFVSILLDIIFGYIVKTGYDIKNGYIIKYYPKHYLTQPFYLTIVSSCLWAIIWPIIAGMVIFSKLPKIIKK